MLSEARNDLSFSHNQAGLRRAKELVATKRNHVNTALDDLAHDGFINDAVLPQIGELARAAIFIDRQTGLMRQGRELCALRRTRETYDAVVRRVNAHDQPCIRVDGALVVVQVSSICRPD